jgi:hypothetical protein
MGIYIQIYLEKLRIKGKKKWHKSLFSIFMV